VDARFKAIKVQLQSSEDETVAVNFPAGERQIAQSRRKR
jgi:hypothetical protein